MRGEKRTLFRAEYWERTVNAVLKNSETRSLRKIIQIRVYHPEPKMLKSGDITLCSVLSGGGFNNLPL